MNVKISKDIVKGKECIVAMVTVFDENTTNITKIKLITDTVPKLMVKLQEVIYEQLKTD